MYMVIISDPLVLSLGHPPTSHFSSELTNYDLRSFSQQNTFGQPSSYG